MTPILPENVLEFVSHSPEQTQRLGAHLGTLLQGGHVLCLEGLIGSGKTCLAQGIGRGWGTAQSLISPSFVLIREYPRSADRVRLYHIDLYRIEGVAEALGLGLDELLGDQEAICIVEWAERARPVIPPEHLWIRMEYVDNTRRLMYFLAQGGRYAELLREFRRLAFGV